MLSTTQLITQVTVGFQSLSIDSFVAIGISMFIAHKVVSYAYSNVAQWFWVLLSIFIFYSVANGSYPIFSFEFFGAVAIFGTASPVISRTYRYFVRVKNKVMYVAPQIPTYQPRFGYTEEEMQIKKSADKRSQEQHNQQQQYFKKIIKKIDDDF